MSAAMKLDAERAAFEHHAFAAGYNIEVEDYDGEKKYCNHRTEDAWEVWQASHATPPQGELSALPELPKPIGYAQKQPLLEYAPCTMLYSAKPVPENGHECVALFSEDQVRDLLCRQSGDAADKRDAERYRWLLEPENTDGAHWVANLPPKEVDKRIDAAIAQRQEGGNG